MLARSGWGGKAPVTFERPPTMLFNSTEYGVFLVVVFVLFWALARYKTMRLVLLLVASYLFYASWNLTYLGLIVFSTAVDYFIGLAMASTEAERKRKALLVLSLGINLGMLAVFKYYNFFIDSIERSVDFVGQGPVALPHLDVLLPVGISFYTFQTLSYSIDLYRRRIEPCRNPLKFFVYVAFFPQLVAGPIVRAVEFLPQLDEDPKVTAAQVTQGGLLIMMGLIKKVAIGDYIALNFVDRVFDTPEMFSALEILMAVYGYGMQIYCDFSGYTDVAIGSSLLMGFTLPVNFNRPYKADSIQDFWHRWHITLSTWLRDYLFIPLGGSRGSNAMIYRNLLLTMLLGGLWHGASWHFVMWGAAHGLMLALTRAWKTFRTSQGIDVEAWPWYRPLMVFLTFQFVSFTWILFRCEDMDKVMAVMERLGTMTTGAGNLTAMVMLLLWGRYAWHMTPNAWRDRAMVIFNKLPVPVQVAVFVGIVVVLQRVAETDVVPFIYFQF